MSDKLQKIKNEVYEEVKNYDVEFHIDVINHKVILGIEGDIDEEIVVKLQEKYGDLLKIAVFPEGPEPH